MGLVPTALPASEPSTIKMGFLNHDHDASLHAACQKRDTGLTEAHQTAMLNGCQTCCGANRATDLQHKQRLVVACSASKVILMQPEV